METPFLEKCHFNALTPKPAARPAALFSLTMLLSAGFTLKVLQCKHNSKLVTISYALCADQTIRQESFDNHAPPSVQ
eukprot:scaffold105509_cov21-Tisochrysis_lutea.AAC.3